MTRLRRVLVDSHVAAVAVAVLLVWSMSLGLQCLWDPVYKVLGFLFTAIAILDIPYWSPTVSRTLLDSLPDFLNTTALLLLAWLLSRLVYGAGPIRVLSGYRARLGRKHAESI